MVQHLLELYKIIEIYYISDVIYLKTILSWHIISFCFISTNLFAHIIVLSINYSVVCPFWLVGWVGKGATACKVTVSIMLTWRIVPSSNPTQVKSIKLLVSLANLAVWRINWASMWAIVKPCLKYFNYKKIQKVLKYLPISYFINSYLLIFPFLCHLKERNH